jgi:Holliday junction resolvase RusA-like endonuclease
MDNLELNIKDGINSNKKNEAMFLFKTTFIPSVNAMYQTKIVKGTVRKFRAPEVIQITKELELQLDDLWDETLLPWFRKTSSEKFSFTIQPLLKTGFESRDLDNTNKVVQDVIFSYFEVNDSKIIENHMFKSRYQYSDYEYLIVKISESTFDPYYFENNGEIFK